MLFKIFKISGHSMEPILKNGQIVLASSIPYFFKKPQLKDIIVFKKNNKNFVKRISYIKGQEYFVEGDNSADSFDSRKFGNIVKHEIQAKVLFV